MSETTDNLERDVESTRAELDRALDELRSKASVDNLTEEAMDYLRKGGGMDIATAVWRQARDHPLPLVMIATGLVWLAASQGRGGDGSERLRMPRQPSSGGPAEDIGQRSPFGGDPVTDRERRREGGDSRRGRARGMASRYGRRARGVAESNPMMAIAAGFAVGIAAGALAMRSVGDSGDDAEEWMHDPLETEPPYPGAYDDPLAADPLAADPMAAPDTGPAAAMGAASPSGPAPTASSRRTSAGRGATKGATQADPGHSGVDEALEESFPASDPPSYTSGRPSDGRKS
jgi:hypothetical protein